MVQKLIVFINFCIGGTPYTQTVAKIPHFCSLLDATPEFSIMFLINKKKLYSVCLRTLVISCHVMIFLQICHVTPDVDLFLVNDFIICSIYIFKVNIYILFVKLLQVYSNNITIISAVSYKST